MVIDLKAGVPQHVDVALGDGQIDIPAVIREAQKAGVEHFYIEDESADYLIQVPQSILYLKSLK